MITTSNLQQLLLSIGFVKEPIGEVFQKQFATSKVFVDFDNKKINYPEAEGLIVNDKTTSNFEHDENFVVLECVCRLLDKGYRPEHIELEPRWNLGHDAKGGKADILVKDENGKSLLIIECKTSGSEFNKEKKNTEEDGGQLFSYWQQEGATRWLALYASDWKDNLLSYKCLVIDCTDDANIVKIAETDSDVHIYAQARNDKERFEIWRDTYNKQWLDDVVFSDESSAYKIGIPPLRKGNLRDFTPEDRIVNRFEEILRHNNVSDKENAFNRLVALFICKLVDEIKKQDFDIVDFQYKQGSDTYESLQDRLQRLHTQGMEEFMKEKIFYVEADYAERLFTQYTGRQRKAAIEDLNRTIRILKFYSNNDFAFKDVHNEELFFQNGKILVEVVQLFQSYRIVYPSKHQFLGDLFEQLLNKGFKQNEGQFFTPTPITRFIWDSLPLQNYVSERELPRVIDYACGAGHFLTEAVEAINAVRKDADNSWVEKHIYGIEKDYRLARVSKISMFMNGAGGANIIFGDGLENYTEKGITTGSFDILVANPPYSVSGFKQHLKLKNNAFDIIDKISMDGSEIETLFVERTAQLLKPCGIAAVVLPASILSNSSNSYIAAREQLLQNFKIHAIVNFGSKTFGATGTNTVVLFLERYNEPPRVSEMAKDTVEGILQFEDDEEWQDAQVLDAYTNHQSIDSELYKNFVSQTLSWDEITSNEYLKIYADAFGSVLIKYPKNATDAEKESLRLQKFYEYALEIEREKLYYFTLVWQQLTLVISAPTDNKEQKEFLGYDWSNRKGAEGIVITRPGGKLYNADDRFSRGTLACAVRNTYLNAITTLPDEVAPLAKSYRLKDMMEFGLDSFNKAISPSVKVGQLIQTKYPLVRLGDSRLFSLQIGKRVVASQLSENGNYPVYSANVKEPFGYINELLFTDFHQDSILWGIDGDWMTGYIEREHEFYPTDHCGIIHTVSDEVEPYFVALVLEKIGNLYGFSRTFRASTERISAVTIPLPPIDIQCQIVAECKKIDDEYNTSRMTIESYRQKISEVFENLEVITHSRGGVKLSKLILPLNGNTTKISANEIQAQGKYPVVTQESDNLVAGYTDIDDVINDLPLIVFGDHTCVLKYVDFKFVRGADGTQLIKVDENRIRTKFLCEYLKTVEITNANKYERHFKYLKDIKIPMISLQTQDQLLSTISTYESKIAEARTIMDGCAARKQAILDKYLQ